MIRNVFYRLLERPTIYRLSQLLIAPGGEKILIRKIKQALGQLPPAQRILDIGCGPSSALWQMGLSPVGLDLSFSYSFAFFKHGGLAVRGSAEKLPFLDGSFDGVWSIGLFHHLPDEIARRSIAEMVRVCRSKGYIVIFDGIFPEPAWRRPLAYLVRKMDRGRFMRTQSVFESLLFQPERWVCERIPYSLTGLEGVLSFFSK